MITKFITRNSIKQLMPNLLTAFHVVAPVRSENVMDSVTLLSDI